MPLAGKRVLFLGCGHMGGAILRGLLSANSASPHDITILTRSDTARKTFADVPGLTFVHEGDLCNFDILFLGVRPADFSSAILGKKPPRSDAIVISMMASISIAELHSIFSTVPQIVRVMPNMPVAVRKGITAVSSDHEAAASAVHLIFKDLGESFIIPEDNLHNFTAICGCGPAYLYNFAAALHEKAAALGFSADTARAMVCSLFDGCSDVMRGSTDSFAALCSGVCSKGGITIEAVNSLNASNRTVTLVSEAVNAAVARSIELSK